MVSPEGTTPDARKGHPCPARQDTRRIILRRALAVYRLSDKNRRMSCAATWHVAPCIQIPIPPERSSSCSALVQPPRHVIADHLDELDHHHQNGDGQQHHVVLEALVAIADGQVPHATAAHLGPTRLMLHARSLSFQSIENGETLTVCADTDESWRIWLDTFEA